MSIKKGFLNFFYCPFLFLTLASCNRNDSKDVGNVSTLREEAIILESRISWAKEMADQSIEYEIPEKKIEEDPVLITLLDINSTDMIYPSMQDFTELDISAYSNEQKSVLEGFCSCLIKGKSIDGFIMNGFAYTGVLFKYNLEKENISFSDFTDYYLGKPFVNEKECQCPVRFYLAKNKVLDVVVYMEKSGQNWKINQIEFKKLRGKDEY